MKAALTPITQYQVQIDGVDLGTFADAGTWEGMLKLTRDRGKDGLLTLIVEEPRPIATFLAGTLLGNKQLETDVLRISPSLLGEVMDAVKGGPVPL